jgi:hypothetical protein
MAVETKNYAKVRVLFNRGGVHYNLRLISNSQTLILHRCARLGDVTMVQLLLEEEVLVEAHQSFLDAVSMYGFTALQWCALYDHAALAEELIKYGCDTTHTNYRHKTAWDIAEAMQASSVLMCFERLASSHPQLAQEQQRRMHRPKVPDTFRDDIQLDVTRFVLWSVMLFVEPKHWLQIAQGGFGTVYKVTDVSPPIAVSGTFYQTVAIKIPNSADAKAELKAEVESLSVLTHGAL